MNGSNLHESLLAGSRPSSSSSSSSSSPSRTAATGSDDDMKTEPTLARLPPPPPPDSPPLPVHKDRSGTGTSSPSPPSVGNATLAKNLSSPSLPVDRAKSVTGTSSPPPLPVENATVAKNLSSPSLPLDKTKSVTGTSSPPPLPVENATVAKNLSSPSLPLDKTKSSTSPSSASPPSVENATVATNGDPSNALGLQEDATASRTSVLTSPRNSLVTSPTSSSPTAPRGWFGLRRRQLLLLPVYAPPAPPGRSCNWFHEWKEKHRPMAPRLDSVGVEKVIGIFGFSLFGSISLLPSTMDRIKTNNLPDRDKTALMVCFGLIWIAASLGVLCGLHGKSDFEQAVCRHTGRLSMMALVLLVILHVRWALPAGLNYDIGCYILVAVAVILHFCSWIASLLAGEDKMEDAAPTGEQQ